MQNSKFLIIIFFLFLLITRCSDQNDRLRHEDYKILSFIINNSITPGNNYLEDDALKKYKKGTEEYRKKVIDLLENNTWESTYYFSINDSTFTYATNTFIEQLFREYDFRKEVPKNMTSQVIDFSKIALRKNLVRVKKNDPLSKSENYIGDFKLSTIIHERSNAAIIFVKKDSGEDGRKIYFFKKEHNEWVLFGGGLIPAKYFNKEINL